eukprot:12108762-Alexandrium_andersonii.AAC.1
MRWPGGPIGVSRSRRASCSEIRAPTHTRDLWQGCLSWGRPDPLACFAQCSRSCITRSAECSWTQSLSEVAVPAPRSVAEAGA